MPLPSPIVIGDATLYTGDALKTLRRLPDHSVHCVVTSPPYWGLRDYGTGRWVGGDASCDHRPRDGKQGSTGQRADRAFTGAKPQRQICSRCGAKREDQQIGLEASMRHWTRALVRVFREIRRVLRRDGTLWVNVGDSYCHGPGRDRGPTTADGPKVPSSLARRVVPLRRRGGGAVKPKDLLGMPWSLAFALRNDGWWLRNDIIWHKLNPTPETVFDRCTTSHEYLFLLSAARRYYFDAAAISEPASPNTNPRTAKIKAPDGWDTGPGAHGRFHRQGREKGQTRKLAAIGSGVKNNGSFDAALISMVERRNRRSVWPITTQAFPGAHFATFPRKLVEPCILAGCPKGGVVLDPFSGTATTGEVALSLGRRYIGIELNHDYQRLAEQRLRAALLPRSARPRLGTVDAPRGDLFHDHSLEVSA